VGGRNNQERERGGGDLSMQHPHILEGNATRHGVALRHRDHEEHNDHKASSGSS
jgi:hypothetical protein